MERQKRIDKQSDSKMKGIMESRRIERRGKIREGRTDYVEDKVKRKKGVANEVIAKLKEMENSKTETKGTNRRGR